MTAPLSDNIKKKILADWHIGMTQNAICLKYEVSKGVVNKLCKGVTPRNLDNVTDLTRIRLDLAEQPDQYVTAVNREVDLRTQDMSFFRSASLKIAAKAIEKLDNEDLSMADVERAQNIIGKGKENIYGKQPDTAVQVNNDIKTFGWMKDE